MVETFTRLIGEVLELLRKNNFESHHSAIISRLEDAVASGIPPGYFQALAPEDQDHLLDVFVGACTPSGRSSAPPAEPVLQLAKVALSSSDEAIFARLAASQRTKIAEWPLAIARLAEHCDDTTQVCLCYLIARWLIENDWRNQVDQSLARWLKDPRSEKIRSLFVRSTKSLFPPADDNTACRFAWFIEHAYGTDDLDNVRKLIDRISRSYYRSPITLADALTAYIEREQPPDALDLLRMLFTHTSGHRQAAALGKFANAATAHWFTGEVVAQSPSHREHYQWFAAALPPDLLLSSLARIANSLPVEAFFKLLPGGTPDTPDPLVRLRPLRGSDRMALVNAIYDGLDHPALRYDAATLIKRLGIHDDEVASRSKLNPLREVTEYLMRRVGNGKGEAVQFAPSTILGLPGTPKDEIRRRLRLSEYAVQQLLFMHGLPALWVDVGGNPGVDLVVRIPETSHILLVGVTAERPKNDAHGLAQAADELKRALPHLFPPYSITCIVITYEPSVPAAVAREAAQHGALVVTRTDLDEWAELSKRRALGPAIIGRLLERVAERKRARHFAKALSAFGSGSVLSASAFQ